jgi:hypothetical protein
MCKELQKSSDEIGRRARLLAQKAGFGEKIHLIPLQGGRNNRVYKMEAAGTAYLLKSYFRHDQDPRDRLGAEFSFISFAWQNGIRAIPRPIAHDGNTLGLYEFINGRKLNRGEVSENLVKQALDIFLKWNRHKNLQEAKALPTASEGCFCLREHISCVDRRLKSLRAMETTTGLERRALGFVQNELTAAWAKVQEELGNMPDVDLDERLSEEDCCLSPSDFGFHNAICEEGDRVRFIDFEYAGWDDPAKMVCDFFCQIAVPVPIKYFSGFKNAVVDAFHNSTSLNRRIQIALPIYQIKWCCIILNEFLPVGIERRDFAQRQTPQTAKEIQLEKARQYLTRFQAQPLPDQIASG